MPQCSALRPWLLLPLLLWLAGCKTTIAPPDDVAEPTTVFVLDHGRHASLVLPTAEGAVRYSYGDWDYYALRQTGLWSGLRALVTPSPAALGRQPLSLAPTGENLPGQLRVVVDELLPIQVDAGAVAALRRELDDLYDQASGPRHYSAPLDVSFVRYPTAYSFGHNSNRKVAQWLEQLGCEVRGPALLSNWRLAEASY